jgi:hypothetical protein
VIDTRTIWVAKQSLNGSLIDSTHEPKLRAVIRRNAYDEQSYARVEAWTADGWSVIHSVPITDLPIAAYDYVYGGWDRDHFAGTVLGRAGMPFWEEAMATDLVSLIDFGKRFFAR